MAVGGLLGSVVEGGSVVVVGTGVVVIGGAQAFLNDTKNVKNISEKNYLRTNLLIGGAECRCRCCNITELPNRTTIGACRGNYGRAETKAVRRGTNAAKSSR